MMLGFDVQVMTDFTILFWSLTGLLGLIAYGLWLVGKGILMAAKRRKKWNERY